MLHEEMCIRDRQKGEAYNNAYAQDYGKYQDYLSQLGTLHDYYSAQRGV